MEKNWLIRTKSKQILGPVSKSKIVELLQNGLLKPEDEICSGNGYWFFVKEEELVQRFVHNDEKQSFNPLNEAQDRFSAADGQTSVMDLGQLKKSQPSSPTGPSPVSETQEETAKSDDSLFPKDEDLEYPS